MLPAILFILYIILGVIVLVLGGYKYYNAFFGIATDAQITVPVMIILWPFFLCAYIIMESYGAGE